MCCIFVPQLNLTEILAHQLQNNLEEPDWGYWFENLPKGAKPGQDNGYKIVFDIQSFEYSENYKITEGLKIALFHFLDKPIMKLSGFEILTGSMNQISVSTELISTSNGALKRFNPMDRECFSENEIYLKYLPREYGYRYAFGNCIYESTLEQIVQNCKCFPGIFLTARMKRLHFDFDACFERVNS